MIEDVGGGKKVLFSKNDPAGHSYFNNRFRIISDYDPIKPDRNATLCVL